MSNLVEIKKKIAKLKKEYIEEARKEFNKASKNLFVDHPGLVSFGWTEYTPYFNDGEPWTFRVNTYDPSINGSSYGEESEPKLDDKEFDSISKKVTKLLDSFDENFFKEVFGDHVRVTVTKDGIDIEEYSHD